MRVVVEQPVAAILALAAVTLYIVARTRWGRRVWQGLIELENPLASRVKPPRNSGGRLLVALESLVILLLALSLAGPVLEYEENVQGDAASRSVIQVPPRPGLVLLVDASGSMMGWKIEAVKKAATRLVEELDPRIDIGFIAFSSTVEKGIPPTDNRRLVIATISTVEASGGTMFSYPLSTALTWLEVYRELGLPAAMVLLSDGVPADHNLLQPLVDKAASMGIVIHTIYTGDADTGAELLISIAEATGGRSYRVGGEDQLLEAFREIGSDVNTSLVAEAEVDAVLESTVTVEKPLSPYLALAALFTATLATLYRHRASGLAF